MTAQTITEDVDLPSGTAPTGAGVTVRLIGTNGSPLKEAYNQTDGVTIAGFRSMALSLTGSWSLTLDANDELLPAGTVWGRTIDGRSIPTTTEYFTVPTAGGPYRVDEILTDAPGTIESGALGTHQAAVLDSGVHGVVDHSWSQDDWSSFTKLTMTADGGQAFSETVSDGRGTVTGLNAGNASLRIAYARDNTEWADSEIRSVIWGPTGWDGTNAQQGHLHRVREVSTGLYEGIAIWTSVVFGGDYRYMQCAGVRFDGTSLLQSSNDGSFADSDSAYIDRKVQVTGRERIAPFGLERAVVQPIQTHHLRHLVDDVDTVTSELFDDTSFNEVDAIVQEYTDQDQLTFDSSGSVTAWASVRRGTITPTSNQKRWVPYVLATRVVGGDSSSVPAEVKRWRIEEPEPDWSDARVRRGAATANVDVPDLATSAGKCALWAAHFHDSSAGTFGDVRFRKI